MADKKTSNEMWGGRFAAGPSAIMEEINASIGFDRKLYAQDIAGSIAHSRMLVHQGVINAEDQTAIEKGLHAVLTEIEAESSNFVATAKTFT